MRARLSGWRRILAAAGLQPRRRTAIRNDQLRRRPGNPGHWLPQRYRRGVQGAARSSRARARAGRARPSDHGSLSHPRRVRIACIRTSPSVSRRISSSSRRSTAPTARRSNLPAASFTVAVSRGPEYVPQTRSVEVSSGPRNCRSSWRDGLTVRARLVFGRPSHPRGGLRALRESDRRRSPAGHVAADRRRSAERRVRSDVGSVLLLPEAVLLRSGSSAVHADTPDALRPGDIRISLEPRRTPRSAWPQGSGLSRTRSGSRTGQAGRCRCCGGRKRRARSSGSPIRVGAWRCEAPDLPNYEMPGFDGIGANEFIVDVTQPNAVDFISAGDTPYVWELNIWYHTLNVGFRTRISGETDLPCITDDRVGLARSYAKRHGPLTYRRWIDAVQAGRSYVSDGKSHLLDFSVNGMAIGTGDERGPTRSARASPRSLCAPLPISTRSRTRRFDSAPLRSRSRTGTWNARGSASPRQCPSRSSSTARRWPRRTSSPMERSRRSRSTSPIERSSWIAARILPSSHTNPMFAIVADAPIRASRRSAEWCLECREPMLDAEGGRDSGERARRGAAGVRSRQAGVSRTTGRNLRTPGRPAAMKLAARSRGQAPEGVRSGHEHAAK